MPRPTSLPVQIAGLQPDLLRVAHHLTGSIDQAQDLSQEVLLKLWQKHESGAQIENLRAYAMTTLRNTYRQMLRGYMPRTELEDDMLVAPPAAFASIALNELDAAIAHLSAEQALLIRLVASGETSPAALARLTDCPKGTVMSRLARARVQLRHAMGLGQKTSVSELI